MTKAKPYEESKEVALLRCEDLIRRILDETQADTYQCYIGGSENFRYQIYPEYKANRKDHVKPTWLQDVREYLVTEHNAIICDSIEADDAMGIAQCKGEDTVICTIDKDLLMIPGRHYNFVKQEWLTVNELTGLKYFYQQLIQGDQTDNIPGYDGKMRPKVPKFLQPAIDELWCMDNEHDMFNHVLRMYNGEFTRMKLSAQVLWIQHSEGDIWQPPNAT